MKVDQVNEKFKDVKVTFSSYYKFAFTYTGQSEDGYKVTCVYGGDSDDIYRFEANTNPESFGECNEWSFVMVEDKEGNEVFSKSFDW